MHSTLSLDKVFQASDIVFFPCVAPVVVLRHIPLVGGDAEAVLDGWRVGDTVLVHLCEDLAKYGRVWLAVNHFDEVAEVEVRGGVGGIGAHAYRSGDGTRGQLVEQFCGLKF